jgi:RNA polymerase sigma factor (sigma-70 family)
MDEESIQLVARLQNGDAEAADALFRRYVQRLIGLARKRMSHVLARRLDAEDIVQSVFRSFFVHARDGRFAVERSGDLWRLLAAITVNKVHRQVDHHGAQKRDVGREARGDWVRACAERFATDPGEQDAVAVVDELETFMSGCAERERTILELRLTGASVGEISEAIARSEWTVRRSLQKLQRELEKRLFAVSS